MKKLSVALDKWFHRLDERWQMLPIKKQHQYTLYFFIAYLVLTAGVLINVWYDAEKPDNTISIEHIENPVLKKNVPQDTLSTISKNRIYERK
ncbi:nitrogen regulatory IIA protein [Flavobacterium aquidurense]|uniref:Nitrogen regulatory IIA protein n=2 Tax=Flavobacterium TaxID=237 RepID=A0A7W7N6H2_9FLAO|nr:MULTISPECIES: nitrogen regulatory IIA protein [Flavobacterium]MBB4801678.1 hypothetical protein [Flavobacterium nitrogenifigens]MBB6386636.1 hypothetical protein [Flavobacterium notoginsengisoli]